MEPTRDPFQTPEVPQPPEIPESLIVHLRAVFTANPSRKEESLWYYGSKAGEQRVIEHLIKLWREQQIKETPPSVFQQT